MRLGTVVGMLIAVVIVGALWSVTRLPTREPERPRTPATAMAPDSLADPGDGVVDQALLQIPGADSTLLKMRWMDEVAHIDLAGLSENRLAVFVRHANARRCTCGCGYTLAACRTYDPTCPESGPILEALRDSVRSGRIRHAEGLRARPEGASNAFGG